LGLRIPDEAVTEKRKLPPRNYFALPVPRTRQESEPVFHDRLDADLGSGVIELDVETLSPVHVGSGTFGIFQGQLVKELMRRAGEPIVPGSSIKGMCRQVYEVLTDSASPFREMYRKSRQQPLSAAGALFGALGYQGRIGFDDAVLKADVELIRIELSVAYPPQREKAAASTAGSLRTRGSPERSRPWPYRRASRSRRPCVFATSSGARSVAFFSAWASPVSPPSSAAESTTTTGGHASAPRGTGCAKACASAKRAASPL